MTGFKDMPSYSRVWIYQGERPFTPAEVETINSKAGTFVSQWTSHDQLMKACIEVFHDLFIVICVDEKTAPASGCGIDKSVKFIQQLEKDLSVSLMDRMNVAYRKNGKILSCRLSELKNAGASSAFNNLIQTKEELENSWEVAIEKSWHKQFT